MQFLYFLRQGVALSDEQLTFTNDRPYVIYGYAAVPENKTMVVDPGARIHFHENSGLWVQENASLQINGTLSADTLLLENEIVFEGDRLEPEFENIAGQWGTVWLSKGSTNNIISNLTLKNATIGLFVEGDVQDPATTLTIKNTQVYNSASVNLWANTAKITGENVVLGGAGDISLYCSLGGDYSFTHSTIANYWSNGFRNGPALRLDNELNLASGEVLQGDLENASFVNCIISGSSFNELDIFANGSNAFNFNFDDCILQFEGNTDNPLLDFTDTTYYNSIYLNENTDFKKPILNDFRLGAMSFAIDRGQTEAAAIVPADILGVQRTASPDLGAYEATIEN